MAKLSPIETRPAPLAFRSSAAWNRFAEECGAGFHARRRSLLIFGAYRLLTFRGKLRAFDLVHEGKKIGQAALICSRHDHVFIDRLMILPQYETLWSAGFEAILGAAGAGRYRYGWKWSVEPARHGQAGEIAGVRLENVRPITVQYVDFARFADWIAYHSALGGAVKRNGDLAKKRFSDIRLDIREGWAAISVLRRHIALRRRTLASKSLSFKENFEAIRYAGGALALGDKLRVLTASADGRILASKRLISLGHATYYLDSGRASDDHGLSWLLMAETLRTAFDRHPAGKFVMGHVDYAIHDESVGGGLIQSRRWCRAVDQESSIFSFRYEPRRYP